MPDSSFQTRPPVDRRMSRAEFERWYWPVSELLKFCEQLHLPKSGRKKDLRERISKCLAGIQPPQTILAERKIRDDFDWKSAKLSRETAITESITFGPNVRRFFKSQIGSKFVCHSDFMEWVKTNIGLTLSDAVEAWHMLEARKSDPEFRREIAECNNYLQYLRDFRDSNPTRSIGDAKECWDQKKLRPAEDGRVIYQVDDLQFIPEAQ